MPAWMAGIQIRRMLPETSVSAWIPALHAGMTESGLFKLSEAPAAIVFKGVSSIIAYLILASHSLGNVLFLLGTTWSKQLQRNGNN